VSDITTALRAHQEADPILGGLFRALHTFADRTIDEFYHDTPDLPYPVVAMEKDRRSRRGYYTDRDGYALVHRINLNPYCLRNGAEAAETLAHELVHLWQSHVGRPIKRNYHSAEFHQRMAEYGIETTGKLGTHVSYLDVTWPNWMVTNEDLQLENYIRQARTKASGACSSNTYARTAVHPSAIAMSLRCYAWLATFHLMWSTAPKEGSYAEGTGRDQSM